MVEGEVGNTEGVGGVGGAGGNYSLWGNAWGFLSTVTLQL